MDIALRPTTPEDTAFLCRVYGSTRADELAQVDWPSEQKQAFIEMQFNAQHEYYHQHYSEASFDVILVDGQPAGRLYLARWADQIRIVDIALLPEFRGRGAGTALLQEVLAEGRRTNKPVTIHVERFNPALTLYKRLGFNQEADKGVYLFLKWKPENE